MMRLGAVGGIPPPNLIPGARHRYPRSPAEGGDLIVFPIQAWDHLAERCYPDKPPWFFWECEYMPTPALDMGRGPHLIVLPAHELIHEPIAIGDVVLIDSRRLEKGKWVPWTYEAEVLEVSICEQRFKGRLSPSTTWDRCSVLEARVKNIGVN